MKIKIVELEKRLGKKVKRNFKSIGFDTAKKTGIGFVNTNRTHATIDWALVHFESESVNEIYKQMYWNFNEFITKDLGCCVVENVYVGQNPDTSIKLARFGGFAIGHAIQNQVHFETIGAVSSRSKLGINTRKYKGKCKQAVSAWLKSTLNLTLDDDNCADGVVLALLGIIDGLDFRSQKEIKKAKTND